MMWRSLLLGIHCLIPNPILHIPVVVNWSNVYGYIDSLDSIIILILSSVVQYRNNKSLLYTMHLCLTHWSLLRSFHNDVQEAVIRICAVRSIMWKWMGNIESTLCHMLWTIGYISAQWTIQVWIRHFVVENWHSSSLSQPGSRHRSILTTNCRFIYICKVHVFDIGCSLVKIPCWDEDQSPMNRLQKTAYIDNDEVGSLILLAIYLYVLAIRLVWISMIYCLNHEHGTILLSPATNVTRFKRCRFRVQTYRQA